MDRGAWWATVLAQGPINCYTVLIATKQALSTTLLFLLCVCAQLLNGL